MWRDEKCTRAERDCRLRRIVCGAEGAGRWASVGPRRSIGASRRRGVTVPGCRGVTVPGDRGITVPGVSEDQGVGVSG